MVHRTNKSNRRFHRTGITSVLAVLVLFIELAVVPIVQVQAWGRVGHKTVADIAWYRLSPQAKEWVSSVFETEVEPELEDITIDNYTSPLAEVSIWADEIRQSWAYKWTTPLHYVNVHRNESSASNSNSSSAACPVLSKECQFDYRIDCPNDVCVVGAISNYTQHMMPKHFEDGSYNKSHEELLEILDIHADIQLRGRRKAHTDRLRSDFDPHYMSSHAEWIDSPVKLGLYFVTHFVGDIHQPLHVSRAEDQGGNSIEVYFPTHAPHEQDTNTFKSTEPNLQLRKTNLHSVWDDGMIERTLKENYGEERNNFTAALLARLEKLTPEEEAKWLTPPKDCVDDAAVWDWKCVASAWAAESMELALYVAYVDEHLEEFPNSKNAKELPIISEEYYKTRLEVAERRLIQGGLRLARLIEDVVDGAASERADDV